MAKIHWTPKKLETFPAATVPGTQHDVDFMVKDSKRFADSGGWGWAAFEYDAASGKFTARHHGRQAAAGERRQVWIRVPHDREDERLRLHRLREALNTRADDHGGRPPKRLLHRGGGPEEAGPRER